MESLYKELQKWDEASKEIEEDAREMLQRRHSLGCTCIVVSGAILMGIVMFKIGQILDQENPSIFTKVFFNLGAIVCILGGITIGCSYYNDEKYLKGRGTEGKVWVKTVLLREVIIRRSVGYRHVDIYRYLKISYPMGEEMITRELSYSDLHYDVDLLGLDLVGLYGKKITIAYCNKEFYILNRVYPEYDDTLKLEEKTELLKDSETIVRNLVECKDEEQIKKADLQADLVKQMNYKMAKYCSRMANIVGVVVWCILHMAGIKGKGFVLVWGYMIVMLLIFRFGTWHSCKKYCGGIWDRAKMRKVQEELEKGKGRD